MTGLLQLEPVFESNCSILYEQSNQTLSLHLLTGCVPTSI